MFFFKQKTAYELRISDWSSDVCSSDLFARMLAGGEDPHYIARRLVRFAVEDIGLADPAALTQAIAAWQAFERIGSPEGELALAQLVIYLATAPESNAAYKAFGAAQRAARDRRPAEHTFEPQTMMGTS